MLLSEAILLGSIQTKQGFGTRGLTSFSAPCALGTALIACERQSTNWDIALGNLWKKWEYCRTEFEAPQGTEARHRAELDHNTPMEMLHRTIWRLNDLDKWTRPQIAAWVAEQEVLLGIVDAEVKQEVVEVENAPA